MMVHQAVTVRAVLGAHKKKGRKCTQICGAYVVQTRSLHFTFLTYHIVHLLQTNVFFNYYYYYKSIGVVTLHEIKGLHVCLYCVQ